MAFTPNINLEQPPRGSDVGVWDVPVNNNTAVLDLAIGGTATIALNNSDIILVAGQYQAKTIVLGSTLTGNLSVVFPSTFFKSYEIYNTCNGSSAFTVTLKTTIAGAQVICAPPGEMVSVSNIAGSFIYSDLGRVGSYWDYAGSSVPAWVSGCSVPPYLNCDGSAYSTTTFPILALILGSSLLPDARGRVRAAMNDGTSRLISSNGGLDGNTRLSGGGADSVTLATSQIPSHTHVNTLTDPGHAHAVFDVSNGASGGAAVTVGSGARAINNITQTNVTNISINNAAAGGGALHSNMQPTLVAGITLVRAG